jgi:hypothetical protein
MLAMERLEAAALGPSRHAGPHRPHPPVD